MELIVVIIEEILFLGDDQIKAHFRVNGLLEFSGKILKGDNGHYIKLNDSTYLPFGNFRRLQNALLQEYARELASSLPEVS